MSRQILERSRGESPRRRALRLFQRNSSYEGTRADADSMLRHLGASSENLDRVMIAMTALLNLRESLIVASGLFILYCCIHYSATGPTETTDLGRDLDPVVYPVVQSTSAGCLELSACAHYLKISEYPHLRDHTLARGEQARRPLVDVDFILLTTTEGIANGGMKAVSIEGHEMLVANVDGQYMISDARCPHMGGHLPEGTLEGSVLTCPRHHSQFDLRDGSVVRWTDWQGATLSIGKLLRHPRPLRTYQVKLDGANIFVGPQKEPVKTAL